jgi:hypothetical protein
VTGILKAGYPIRLKDDAAGQGHKNQQQNHATTAATTASAPKAKIVLQPVKDDVEQEEFEQPFQTTVATHKLVSRVSESEEQSIFKYRALQRSGVCWR